MVLENVTTGKMYEKLDKKEEENKRLFLSAHALIHAVGDCKICRSMIVKHLMMMTCYYLKHFTNVISFKLIHFDKTK